MGKEVFVEIEAETRDESYDKIRERYPAACINYQGVGDTLLEELANASEKFKLEGQVEDVLDEISRMFRNKNAQYRTTDDDLANFTKGALMLGYEANEIGRFEALKGYVLKHISKVYNGKLNEDKMDESIMDIAVYFILATVMHRRMEEGSNE
jgi:hypothetical protein